MLINFFVRSGIRNNAVEHSFMAGMFKIFTRWLPDLRILGMNFVIDSMPRKS